MNDELAIRLARHRAEGETAVPAAAASLLVSAMRLPSISAWHALDRLTGSSNLTGHDTGSA